MIAKAGETWKVDGRKGPLTICFRTDVDFDKDEFFDADIVAGRARFISGAYVDAQRFDGLGTPGTAMTFRSSLMRLVEKIEA